MTESDEIDLDELKHSDPSEADSDKPQPYKQEENLRKLYHELEWSQSKIADFYDVSQSTISRAMDEAEIEARPSMDERGRRGIYRQQRADFRAQYFIDNFGGFGEDGIATFYESNLVALESFPLELVAHDHTDVHHQLASPLRINISENLQALPVPVHQADHATGQDIPPETFLEQIGEPVDPDVDSRDVIYITTASNQQDPESGEAEEQ